MKRFALITVLLLSMLKGFTQAIPYSPADADGELNVTDTKIILLGYSEARFTGITAIFKKPVSNISSFVTNSAKLKTSNYEVICNNRPLNYSRFDTTYFLVDSSMYGQNQYNWSFYDLTDSNAVITYTPSKQLIKVSGFIFTQSSSLSRANSFTYSHPLIHADSITYILGTDSLTKLKKTISLSSSGITFTSSELMSFSPSNQGSLVIIVYNTMPQFINNRKYYFQNHSMFVVTPLSIY